MPMKLNASTLITGMVAVLSLIAGGTAMAEEYYRNVPAGCTYVTKKKNGGYMLVECSRSGESRINASSASDIATGVVKLIFPIGYKAYSGYWCSFKAKNINAEPGQSRECISKGWIPGKNYAN